jgi:erythromycin esterase
VKNRLAQLLAAATLVAADGFLGNESPPVPTEPVEWFASHAIRVSSVDPADTDFADLRPLRKVIGNSRMILLGEQSHGDGTAFLAKTRLIEFLHQEMGFDVLAFESGLFDMRKAWQAMAAGRDPREAFGIGVFDLWAGSAEVQSLIGYLGRTAATDHPLELAGFDSQFTASGSQDFLLPDLEAFLKAEGSPLLVDVRWPGVRQTLVSLLNMYRRKPPKEDQERFQQVVAETREWLGGHEAGQAVSERQFWSQVLKSVASEATRTWTWDRNKRDREAACYRDEQMADNLIWLADRWYRGRKIIVWAATFHNVRNIRQIDSQTPDLDYSKWVTMGHRVWEALGDDVYSLGFTAYAGQKAEWMEPVAYSLPRPTHGSMEDLMGRAGLRDAIIDFRGAGPARVWLSKPMIARPFGYREMKADWTASLDGMFFDRLMKRSTPARPTAAGRGSRAVWLLWPIAAALSLVLLLRVWARRRAARHTNVA